MKRYKYSNIKMRKRKRKIAIGKTRKLASKPKIKVLDKRSELKKVLKNSGVDLDLNLKYKNGDWVFNSNTPSEIDLSYQIIEMYKTPEGIENVKLNIKTHLNDFDDFYWSFNVFNNIRNVRNEEENSYFNFGKIIEGSIECKRSTCNNLRMRVSFLGTTSGDEAFRIRFVCTKCNYRWTE